MKLARLFCFLIIFGSSAIAAHAQTPVDPLLTIHGSPCLEVEGDACVDLTYTGPTVLCGLSECIETGSPHDVEPPLEFLATSPVGGAVTCLALDLPGVLVPTYTGDIVTGCAYVGVMFGGTMFTAGANGPLNVTFPAAVGDSTVELDPPVPEPGTGILFITGFLLLSLGGFARMRFGASS
jgi:hypothetical protein